MGGADYSSKEGANDPELVLTLGGTPVATNTPTLTPTPGPSPTPTNTSIATATFTPTPTPLLPIFSNAAFMYDGDGKRVKSVITTNIATTTTYFVGVHYEVANGVVTKYYYAGAQRIAMRTTGTLNYLIGDHLGSTSLTTDASGQIVSELRYRAWGETRDSSGNTTTKYTYTGQYSYTGEFGLHFYNARWYDSSLGRFAQADTIVPEGVQGYDRYAYVSNNPLVYTDPTGHRPCEEYQGVCLSENQMTQIWNSTNNGTGSGGGGGGGSGAPDSPGCGVSGGGNFGFHCTKGDLEKATLDQRLEWFQWLQGNMNEYIAPGAGNWFLNVDTVVSGFSATGQDDNQWVLNVDINILISIQNGYVNSLFNKLATDPKSGAGLWTQFFNALKGGQESSQTLISYWGAAERKATNESTAIYKPSELDDRIFLGVSNYYRDHQATYCNTNNCVGGFYDPRTVWRPGFSPVGYWVLLNYSLDTFGYAFTGH